MATRAYIVKAGDTLESIALRELGGADWAADIAYMNGVDRLATLAPGKMLILPVRDSPLILSVKKGLTPTMPTDPTPWGLYAGLAGLVLLAIVINR
jgi:hypothetical protein